MAAARALLVQGQPVTIAGAAEYALVSEPTAYRYYSDVRSLLRDALASRWPTLDDVLAELRVMPGLAARARRAAEAMAAAVLADEVLIRTLIALSYEPAFVGRDGAVAQARPAFRTELIDVVLEAVPADRGSVAERAQIRLALSVIIAAEAVFSLKDATACEDADVIGTLGWAAHRIASASLSACDAATAT